MNFLPRWNFLTLAGALLAIAALPQPASALDYPTRPTKIVAGFAAGAASTSRRG
jgi:tripartite-type tricarboxylate transporter receptor subunit TctC